MAKPILRTDWWNRCVKDSRSERALLNLGADFAIEPQHWPLLTARIEQLLQDADFSKSNCLPWRMNSA